MRWLWPLMALLAFAVGAALLGRHPTPLRPPQNHLAQNAPQVPTEQQSYRADERQIDGNQQENHIPDPGARVEDTHSFHPQVESGSYSNKTEDETTEYWTILRHRLKITDSLLAAFTFALCLIGAWQGSKLNASVREAIKASKAAEDAIELSRREFILAHRPRIRVKHVWLKRLAVGELISIDLAVVNTGYAVPSLITLKGSIFFSNSSHLPERPPIPEFGNELPAKEFINGWTHVIPLLNGAITQSEHSDLLSSKTKMYCVGILDYRHDLSGNDMTGGGTTAYCRVLQVRQSDDGGHRFVIHDDPNYEYQD